MKPIYAKLGFTKRQWNTYKAEAREILIQTARSEATISYSELADRMTSIPLDPFDVRLWEIIGDVGRDEAHAGRGILSVVVVHKDGDAAPGHGFYQLAAYFNRNVSDPQKCFVDELTLVHKQWCH
ncbi:MAG TPA: hypothetical protein VN673_05095 [Clostridia bacterium]|nr:hypothetical protein [Clostridia bacterium]